MVELKRNSNNARSLEHIKYNNVNYCHNIRRKSSNEDTKSHNESLFLKEKARREMIFRNKNAANFNITGQKSYAKNYPIKKVKKVYFNDILSYDQFLAEQITTSIHDDSFDKIKPMSRQLKEVLINKENIIRVKASTLDEQFKAYTDEA